MILEYAVENQNKKIGKNLKTYAQAVGVKVIQKENTTNQGKQNEGNNNSKNKNNKIKGLEQTIKNMEKQIMQLKEIIAEVCDKIVQDEGFKRNIENQLKTVEEYSTAQNNKNKEDQIQDNEVMQYADKNTKQVKWDKTINVDQKNKSNWLHKTLNIRKNPRTPYENITGDIYKGVNWVMQKNKKPKTINQNE